MSNFGQSTIESHRTVVMFTAAGSGVLLTKGDKKIGFQDGENVATAGGYTVGPGDSTIVNGQLQSQESALLRGLQVHVTYGDQAGVVPAAERQALLNVLNLTLNVAGQPYKIGKGINWMGPIETAGAIPMVKAFPTPKEIPGSGNITIEAEINKSISGGVVANKTYAVWFEFPAARAFSNEAAAKT